MRHSGWSAALGLLVVFAAGCSDGPVAGVGSPLQSTAALLPASYDALLVTGARERVSSDNALRNALRVEGFQVDIVDAESLSAETLSGRSLVVVSETVASAPQLLAQAAVPLVVLSAPSAVDLGMASRAYEPTAAKAVTVTGVAPLSAGLEGRVALYKSLRPLGGVEPSPSALIAAHAASGSDRAAIFAYERASRMPAGWAPARRVGFLASFAVPGAVTDDGHSLLAAAFHWAARPRAILVLGGGAMEPGDLLLAERLHAMGLGVRLLESSARTPPPARPSDVWLISASAAESPLATALADLEAPMLVAQPALFQALGMVASADAAGILVEGTQLTLPLSSHPLAASLAGEIPIVTRPESLAWGTPLPAAVFAAEVAPGRAGIFAYEATPIPKHAFAPGQVKREPDGTEMPRGRRLGWFGTPAAFTALTRGGWALFDAAIGWLRGGAGSVDAVPLQACLGLPAPSDGDVGFAGDAGTRLSITKGVQTALEGGHRTVELGGPRVLEIPASLAPVVGDPEATIRITFSGVACHRAQTAGPDAWSALGGDEVVCSYRLAASGTAETVLPESVLVECTGGAVAGDQLVVSGLEVALVGSPHAFVASVNVPGPGSAFLDDPLSPEETRALRTGFDWNATQPVPETNADGHPTVWYALVYLRSDENRAAMDTLELFHRPLPLFTHELERWRGRQGFFRHRGDGEGAFVYALVPGAVYNALRDYALQGRAVFEAVVLQQTPSYARDELGAITYETLASAYPEHAGTSPAPIRTLRSALTDGDVLEAVADLARATRYLVLEGVGEVAKWDHGSVTMKIVTDLRNADPGFGGDLSAATIYSDPSTAMIRPWSAGGTPVTLSHVPVMLMGEYSVLGIPMMFSGSTDAAGEASIDVAIGSSVSVCFEIENDALEIRETFLPIEYCHFVGTAAHAEMPPFEVAIQNGYFNLLAQGTEAREFLQASVGQAPRKTKIITGDLVDWFTKVNGGSDAFVPCFTYGQGTFINVLFMDGTAVTMAALSWCPPLAIGAGITLETYRATLAQNDVFLLGAPNSDAAISRGVFSHEYGHLALCQMIDQAGSDAYEGAVMARLFQGTDPDNDPGYLNEAWADFIASQLVGGVNYFALDGVVPSASMYFFAGLRPGMEFNETGTSDFGLQVGRIATMLHDAFDRQPPYSSGFHSGTTWSLVGPVLVHDSPWNRDGSSDEAIELPSTIVPDLVGLSVLGGGLSEGGLVRAVDLYAEAAGYDECQRCELYAAHQPNAPSDPAQVWDFCRDSAIDDWMVHGMPDPTDPQSCNYQPPPCTLVEACLDSDGDGYFYCDERSQRCQETLTGGWVARAPGMATEWYSCNNDSARHPGAALVCGQDMNCDAQWDLAPGWSCTGMNGDEYYRQDAGWLPTSCGSQRGAAVCNLSTGCIEEIRLPDRMTWTGADGALSHGSACDGYKDGSTYVVPAQHDTCWAQYGPYMNNLATGRYVVGFKVYAAGQGAYATFDVAKNGGDVIKATKKLTIAGGANRCIQIGPLDLATCQQLEFRIKYNSAPWYETAHTLKILGTAVVPEGMNPCSAL